MTVQEVAKAFRTKMLKQLSSEIGAQVDYYDATVTSSGSTIENGNLGQWYRMKCRRKNKR